MNRFFAWFGTNEGRIVSILALMTEIGGALWNVHKGAALDLGPGGLGGGLGAVLGASAALLAAPPAARALQAHLQRKATLSERHDA